MDSRPDEILASPGTHFAPFRIGPLLFREARGEADMQAIHRLHFRTFTRELGQYPDQGQGYHVDKFHAKNHYLICEADGVLVGMLAAHDRPPFSFAQRLPVGVRVQDLSERPLEVRLLTVADGYRKGRVAGGLMYAVYRWAAKLGYPAMFISAVENQLRLYRTIGFHPLGPPVPQGDCRFTPMMMRLDEASPRRRRLVERLTQRGLPDASLDQPLSLLPGPPQLSKQVLAAVSRRPIYHRSAPFIELFESIRRRLSPMMGGHRIALLHGSGTLANDCVAAQLRARFAERPGLVLVSGEFGDRLVRQAQAAGLAFEAIRWPWGQTWGEEEIFDLIAEKRPAWIWAVQIETSTGVLQPVNALVTAAQAQGSVVALDCVSAVGAVPLPAGAELLSGVSGKCLGGLAGVAMVAASEQHLQAVAEVPVPSSFDLVRMMATSGPCFTFPSAPIQALDRALESFNGAKQRAQRRQEFAALAQQVRHGMRTLGLEPFAAEAIAAPVVTTFTAPFDLTSLEFVAQARSWGFRIAGASTYLQRRRLVQVAHLGEIGSEQIDAFLSALSDWMKSRPTMPPSRRPGD